MPNRELLKQLEMERQRRGITRSGGGAIESEMQAQFPREQRYAWEYELEAYRTQQKRTKWLVAGALCGVLSLVLEVAFHWETVMNLLRLWPVK